MSTSEMAPYLLLSIFIESLNKQVLILKWNLDFFRTSIITLTNLTFLLIVLELLNDELAITMTFVNRVPDAYDLTLEDFLRCLWTAELGDEVIVNVCDGAFYACLCDGTPETPG